LSSPNATGNWIIHESPKGTVNKSDDNNITPEKKRIKVPEDNDIKMKDISETEINIIESDKSNIEKYNIPKLHKQDIISLHNKKENLEKITADHKKKNYKQN